MPRQTRNGDQTERVDIGLSRNNALVEEKLFRRDVVVFARKTIAEHRLAVLGFCARLGNPEIDDLGMADHAVLHDDIVRAEVAVNDAKIMRPLQARRYPREQLPHVCLAEGSFDDNVRKGAPLDKFHHEAGPSQDRVLGKNVIANNGFVVQIPKDRRLALKQRKDRFILRQIGQDDLDRHRLVGVDIFATVDFTHAPGCDHFGDRICADDLCARGHTLGVLFTRLSVFVFVVRRHVVPVLSLRDAFSALLADQRHWSCRQFQSCQTLVRPAPLYCPMRLSPR